MQFSYLKHKVRDEYPVVRDRMGQSCTASYAHNATISGEDALFSFLSTGNSFVKL